MKDARGRTIRKGDTVVYAVTGGVSCVNAAKVLRLSSKGIDVEVISHTEYGTHAGKKVTLTHGTLMHGGANPFERVMVIVGKDGPVDLSEAMIGRWDA